MGHCVRIRCHPHFESAQTGIECPGRIADRIDYVMVKYSHFKPRDDCPVHVQSLLQHLTEITPDPPIQGVLVAYVFNDASCRRFRIHPASVECAQSTGYASTANRAGIGTEVIRGLDMIRADKGRGLRPEKTGARRGYMPCYNAVLAILVSGKRNCGVLRFVGS